MLELVFSRDCQVMIRSSLVSLNCSVGIYLIVRYPQATSPTHTAVSLSICFHGTRPTNIMRYTLMHSNKAVDRFSVNIRMQLMPVIPRIYFMALGSASPFSFSDWVFHKISATTMIVPIFANSDGWNWMNPKSIHRFAEFVTSPMINTKISIIHDTGRSKIA